MYTCTNLEQWIIAVTWRDHVNKPNEKEHILDLHGLFLWRSTKYRPNSGGAFQHLSKWFRIMMAEDKKWKCDSTKTIPKISFRTRLTDWDSTLNKVCQASLHTQLALPRYKILHPKSCGDLFRKWFSINKRTKLNPRKI